MARKERSAEHGNDRLEKATYQPGDYGRMIRPDGTESIEEVKEPTELIERSVQLMNALRGDGWKVA